MYKAPFGVRVLLKKVSFVAVSGAGNTRFLSDPFERFARRARVIWGRNFFQNGEQEKALSYLSELNVEEHIMSEQILYTKNSVLNYMLNRNIIRCKEKGIDVKCMVTGSIDGIPDRDVYILAGNLFENAVEAACQAENPYISITICGNDTCLYFEFYNSTKENVMQTNPQLKTTKTEKAVHGYGIENVREIVKKYHGTIEYRSEGDSLFVCKTVLIKENVEL